MKALKFCVAALMAAGIFTSCLDGGNTREGIAYGVVEYSMDAYGNVAYIDDYGTNIKSPVFDKLNPGDCVGFMYRIDFEEQNSNKFFTATVNNYEVYKKWYADFTVDTTTIEPEELIIDEVLPTSYVKGNLFAAVRLKNIPGDQKNSYTVAYDLGVEPEKNDNGNVYTLFVRSSLASKGEQTPKDKDEINVFYINDFIQQIIDKEKNLDSEKEFVQFKFVFINELNKDKTAAVWKSTDAYTLPIPRSQENTQY